MVVGLPGYTDHGFFIQFHLFSRGVILVPPKRKNFLCPDSFELCTCRTGTPNASRLIPARKHLFPPGFQRTVPKLISLVGQMLLKKNNQQQNHKLLTLEKISSTSKPRNNHIQLYITIKTCKSDITNLYIFI